MGLNREELRKSAREWVKESMRTGKDAEGLARSMQSIVHRISWVRDDQLHQGVERFSRADDIVNNQHALAAHHIRLMLADAQRLDVIRRDGIHGRFDNIRHIELRALTRYDIIITSGLSCHFVSQRNAF